jgi:hypothetical protein
MDCAGQQNGPGGQDRGRSDGEYRSAIGLNVSPVLLACPALSSCGRTFFWRARVANLQRLYRRGGLSNVQEKFWRHSQTTRRLGANETWWH